MRLMIILGSSRQGRRGDVVANWVKAAAAKDSRFEIDYVDSREFNLPFYDEPFSPFDMRSSGKDYTHPEGKAWAQRIGQAEAFIIITPEYNHGYPAVLKNALDWVGPEWVDKPVGFVSYGGVSGGIIAAQQLREVATELGLVQVANGIHFAGIARDAFDQNGQPTRPGSDEKLQKMLNEIVRLHGLFTKTST